MTEPKIWPIGQAFASFVNAYLNLPADEPYSYHGLPMQCKKEEDPLPFDEYLLEEYGADWEIIYHRENKLLQTYTLDYDVWAFKPGGALDGCTPKFPDGFKRYYFCKMEVWDGTSFIGWSADLNGITNCQVFSRGGQWKYFYKTWVATIWAEKPWLVWIYQFVPNSHFIVWRSTTGNMPHYYPVPIEERHED